MNIKEMFEHERYLASISSAYLPEGVFQLLDRIEAKVSERIEELEAQVPRVVKPEFNVGNYDCPDCEYRTLPEPCLYCPGCGAKLDWEER